MRFAQSADVPPVFDAIAQNAARLRGAVTVTVFRFDGQLLHPVAHQNVDPASTTCQT